MMKHRAALTSLLVGCILCTAAHADQVHLGLGMTDDAMTVSWATASSDGTSEVVWSASATLSPASRAVGDIRNFTADAGRVWYTRVAVMAHLDVGARYYYKVGDAVNGYSAVFSFVNRRRSGDGPYRHVLFGDLGTKAGFSVCKACTQDNDVCDAATCAGNRTVGLVSEVHADMMLQVGDFGYDLDVANGRLGDQFMENIEQFAARVPFMVSHGNHEDSDTALAHYVERFRSMPVNSVPSTFETINGVAPNNMYFSWNYGLVHYIAFSSELWYGVADKRGQATVDAFLKWLEDDLRTANLPENRKKAPWILIHGHRPFYCSGNSGCDAEPRRTMEDLLFKYGVSFSVNGHQHNFERSFPVYNNLTTQSYQNPKATIYVVTGAAGSKEMHSPFTTEKPYWVGYRSNTFGYTRMNVYNATHVHFEQVSTDPTSFPLADYGAVIDEWWVVQHHQGPFDPRDAPRDIPTSCDDPELCGEYDHFAPILLPRLGEPEGSARPLHAVIVDYRRTHGEVAWAQQLKRLLAEMSGEDAWEDGNLDPKEAAALNWIDGHDQ